MLVCKISHTSINLFTGHFLSFINIFLNYILFTVFILKLENVYLTHLCAREFTYAYDRAWNVPMRHTLCYVRDNRLFLRVSYTSLYKQADKRLACRGKYN